MFQLMPYKLKSHNAIYKVKLRERLYTGRRNSITRSSYSTTYEIRHCDTFIFTSLDFFASLVTPSFLRYLSRSKQGPEMAPVIQAL